MDDQKPPLGRYILIALAFVALFVGVAYLIFRFSNQGAIGEVTPSPTPTATTSLPSTGYNSVVLPAPAIPALDKSRIFQTPRPIVTTIPATNGQPSMNVALDGKGNLLFNNLTHEENFALLRDRLLSDQQVKLAQLQGQQNIDQLKLNLGDKQADRNTALESQKLALQLQRDQLTMNNIDKQASRMISAQLQLAQLENQLAIAKLQAPQRLSAQAQIAMLTARAKIQAYLTKQQSDAQIAAQTAQNQAQLALSAQTAANQAQLIAAQTQSQSTLTQARTDQQIRLAKESLNNEIARLTETQKVQLANQLYGLAAQNNNYQQALAMTQLQSQIAQAQRSQAHQYNQERAILQADINRALAQSYMALNPHRF